MACMFLLGNRSLDSAVTPAAQLAAAPSLPAGFQQYDSTAAGQLLDVVY